MASLEEFINKTASNVNAGIKGKVEDGSFNRLGEGLSEGVNGIAEGMVSLIGMTKEAFNKLNEKASSIGKSKQPDTSQATPPPPPMQAAAPPQPTDEFPHQVEETPPLTAEPEDSSVFCSQCGEKNPADANFCGVCGAPIQK